MKATFVLFALFFGFVGSIVSQTEMLVGIADRAKLQSSEFSSHFFEEYQDYTPCHQTINKLENKIYTYSITIVLATWCHDSQQQVPRFFKILDELDYNTSNLKIITVDKDKLAGDIDISGLNMELVPTFIFYDHDEEVGRIVETPVETLEKDIYKIVYNK